MSEENVNVVRHSFEAFGRGDFAAVLDTMDNGIEWVDQESLPWGGVHRGHEQLAAHMQSFAANFDEVRVEPHELLDAGERVVVTGRLAGRAAGGEFDVGVAYVWQLRDGKAVSVETYTDTVLVLKALGR
jgi:ketosteroid isomerase-like protein